MLKERWSHSRSDWVRITVGRRERRVPAAITTNQRNFTQARSNLALIALIEE